ncbi:MULTISPECIES: thiamine pyrophosphate-dependent enzyme [unclassified Apibacter]|uniref:thiamine pyrophosphate-dependent enzyme n=1 Tax=unclassified Apibacter TaxID=2630820 RepID=UPI00132114DA|nr:MULTISPECIES: thiamine pyrophosphate-dependent enzyme [unclassified Apibacter]MCX8676193.1 ubiquinone-dependent pyruvate dehydrogenase [Apibacter sp. B3919]MXO25263.1 ubiquinone-dependent pyruvate dehydrogenase [Apibacter sp. B3924]MXO26657.1 ubiquinone-dependent pyruvate dehydrogenase [Apibacter sp. B3813]MXO29386.1 ubiquinone-dependent pyruvate dehydrogenase [Apibacter sp. B3913]MXO30935.1 ubiquinone-dependent pyruvate dehydrogenase [Apibacter sp. B3912]
MEKKVADQLVEILVDAGIKRIYAVTGDSLNELNRAIKKNGKIQWIHVRNEEAGAFAAAAEAELEGIACCAGSSGPGHVHLINGLYEANRANVPVIAIASTCGTREFGTDYFQETNITKLFDDCSVYNQIATLPEQAPRMLQRAIQNAISKKGVAVFGLPGDLESKPAEDILSSLKVYQNEPILRPSDKELQELADVLNEHDKVTIYCGIGASKAHKDLVKLAGKLKAPVGYSFRGKMGIQYDNPYEVGMTGLLGLPSAFQSMHEADVVLLLGTDFPYANFMPSNKKIIQIDERADRLGRRAKVDMGLCGKIEDTLSVLLPLIEEKQDDSFLKKQLKKYDKVKEDLDVYVKDPGKENLIHPEYVASVINNLAAKDAIFTVDTGMCCVWGARYIHATGERKMLGSFSHGTMANAMPMSIGASLSHPDRQIIAFCGDGGISMLLGDLATIYQYKLPVKLFVFNNRSLGMVKLEMEVDGIPDNETDMVNPDFAMIAMAMGFKGINVNKPEEVEGAVKEAFSTEAPVLVNVMTDPNSLALPPKIEWSQIKGMTTSMTKMMLGGNIKEVVDTIQSNIKHIKSLT